MDSGSGRPASATPVRWFGSSASDTEHWSYPEVLDIQAGATTLSRVIARGQRGAVTTDAAGQPALVLVNVVSPDFFEALGVRAAIGRLPGATDREPVIALGHSYWRARFGGDPNVVGRTLALGSDGAVVATIVGVLPETFRELEAAVDRDVWMPPVTWSRLAGAAEFEDRNYRWFGVIGRRGPGRTVAQVDAELQTLVGSIAPATAGAPARRMRVISDRDFRLAAGGRNIVALLALVAVVGLITCTNLAELLLAGVARRRQEFATRIALGASAGRLVRALMMEGILLGLGGLLLATVLTMALLRAVPALLVPPPGFRNFIVLSFDGRALAFLVAVTMLFTMLFSVVPIRTAARSNLMALIKTSSLPRRRTSRLHAPVGLVLQVALAFVLLSAAGVLIRSFERSQSSAFGLTSAPVLTAWSLNDLPSHRRALAEARLRTIDGVTEVAVAIRAPLSLSGAGRSAPVRVPGTEPRDIKYNAVSANYFRVIGTPIIDGRPFEGDDERAKRHVAIVSRTMAAQWPGDRSPIGQSFLLGTDDVPWEVVGVAADAAIATIGEPPEPYIYLPFETFGPGEVTFLLSLRDAVSPPIQPVRSALKEVDPLLEPRRVFLMSDYVAYATRDFRATATLAGALGVLGLLLTLLGVYGVTAYRTTRRTREFGIRAALGARRRQVLGHVLGETLQILTLGVGAGLMASLWVNRVIESLLLGVAPWDPWSLAATTLVLGVSLMAATLGPAVRAASIDPSTALRES